MGCFDDVLKTVRQFNAKMFELFNNIRDKDFKSNA